MKKHLILIVAFIAFMTSCKREEIHEIDSNTNNNKSVKHTKNDNSFLKLKSPSIYFIDEYSCPPVTLSVYPDDYSLDINCGWRIENGQFVAYGYARGYVYDQHGDNCYSLAQVMLVKNNQIFNGNDTGIIRVDGFNQSEASTNVVEWHFPFGTDLNDVYIVSQAAVWACMEHASINGADDKRIRFNLVPLPSAPANLLLNESTISLSWTASSYANSYNIFRKKDNNAWELLDSTTNTSYRDFSVINRPDISIFKYKVQAVNNNGISAFSNIVSTTGNTFD